MNVQSLIGAMERFGRMLPVVVQDVSPNDARWKPIEKDWSILEIVRHLGDEEVDDFRIRLQCTLEDVTKTWPRIDPVGWAIERKYNEGRLDEAVARFVKERNESLKWLRSLKNVDWSIAYQHPKVGPIRAGDLLTGWAAHDSLHLRQISRRFFQLAERDGEGYTSRYAGEW